MDLHEKLVASQIDEELERKASKAKQKGLWTQEEIDVTERNAKKLYEYFNRDNKAPKTDDKETP